ncbi:adenine phosphoribosyltransferase [archaeon]|nr:adenine phosphoribosyltransferase [archaeon]|tara:strand:+ start:3428 stop:3949 length:522 start_codon:yes stop_codon:yes gene_type:complete
MDLKSSIRTIPNFPKEGIMFRDITSLIETPLAFAYCIDQMREKFESKGVTKIVGIESRGFIFGAALAKDMGLPFVLIRKKGKLPGETVGVDYTLEYGTDTVEIHTNSLTSSDNVLVIDDLIATGGTVLASCQLVEKVGAKVLACAFVINLPDLKGMEKISNYNPFCLVEFEGE